MDSMIKELLIQEWSFLLFNSDAKFEINAASVLQNLRAKNLMFGAYFYNFYLRNFLYFYARGIKKLISIN